MPCIAIKVHVLILFPFLPGLLHALRIFSSLFTGTIRFCPSLCYLDSLSISHPVFSCCIHSVGFSYARCIVFTFTSIEI